MLYNGGMVKLVHRLPKSWDDAEIKTFCPTRICLGHHIFDGLLDTVDGDYGGFYVLTDDLLGEHRQAEGHEILTWADAAEVVFHFPKKEFTVTCRVQGCWIDKEGLFAYMRLKFPDVDLPARQQLDNWMVQLW
jgi:hypothetical protein